MAKISVGIDFGNYTLKAVQGKAGPKVNVQKSTQVFNPLGMCVPTDEASAQKLAELVTNMFNDSALARTDVRLSLPEFLVSTKIISIPTLTDAELASAITWQAEQHIRIPL